MTKPSRTQAHLWESALSSVIGGEHGLSNQGGTPMEETSPGQKQWGWSSSSEPSSRGHPRAPPGSRFKIFGGNRGVIEGWWSGRSRNHQVNEAPKRTHCKSSPSV